MYEEIRREKVSNALTHFKKIPPKGEFVILFKGSSEAQLSTDETKREIERLFQTGRSASDILDELQPVSELPRKQLYNLILQLKAK